MLARLTWGGAIGFVLLLLAVTFGFQYAERDEIRSGIIVFGVDVGGMSEAEARAAVLEATEARAGQSLTLVDGERTWQVSQHDVGLRFDVDAAVAQAFDEGRSGFGPERLAVLWHLKQDATPVGDGNIAVSSQAADAVLQQLAADIYLPTIDPDFTIHDDGTYTYVPAQTGRELDIEASRAAVIQAMAGGDSNVELTVTEYPPVAENSDYEDLLVQAERILDAPISLTAAGETWTFTPVQVASRLEFVLPADGKRARLVLDQAWAARVIDEIGWTVNREPQSPRVWWGVNGQLVVQKEPQPGYQIDAGAALELARAAFSGASDANTVDLPVNTLLPPGLPQDLNALGLVGVIAESSTPYGGSIEARMQNIELAARILNGVLIMPGQTFSFNSEIGPMTEDAGFKVAFGIINNDGELRTIPTEAGGICQVATTVFQPVFATGYEIIQRSTHSYWIPSYSYNGMVGLDATVDPAAGLDFKWLNNSPHAVLIQAQADGENFLVRLIGQKPNWQVQIDEPLITDIQWADTETVYYEPDTSIPVGQQVRVERAHDGFDVKIARTVSDPDGTQRYWEDEVTYGKSRNVILVGSEDGELPAGFAPPTS
jgi:vancomycin resistance protein YoaR